MPEPTAFDLRLAFMWPEIALFVTTCIVMVVGLSKNASIRKTVPMIAGLGLLSALYLSAATTPHSGPAKCPISGHVFCEAVGSYLPGAPSGGQVLLPDMAIWAKCLIAIVALLMLLAVWGTVDREEESAVAKGVRPFDALRTNSAEFYAFFLFSITGLMLCASADSLIWLFLALELTSLPTYIMVAISSPRNAAREAGVKYFFLGALGAAIFLFGFTLLYGAAGTTNLNDIAMVFAQDGLSTLAIAGAMLSIVGIGFKIAAVPMHFYTPDVYQGAAPQVSAFLAFVPKTAGFLALLLLCATIGWSYVPAGTQALVQESTAFQTTGQRFLPEPIRLLLWIMAALTMTVGNVLAVLQTNVKRMLAYSSIAHSGYMLVGVIVGPFGQVMYPFAGSGVSAVLFYLLSYGVMNLGTFAVLASLERPRTAADGTELDGDEVEHIDDLRGLCKRDPVLGWAFVVCNLSLLGLPPLLGFFAKVPLFTSAISAGEFLLAIVLGINSAIAAFYYLRLSFTPMLEDPDESRAPIARTPFATRRLAAVVSAGGAVALAFAGGSLMKEVKQAAKVQTIVAASTPPDMVPSEKPVPQNEQAEPQQQAAHSKDLPPSSIAEGSASDRIDLAND